MKHVTEEQVYTGLGAGIVRQGVDDYKRALKELWELEKKLAKVNGRITECERFFNSEYCYMLSKMDGDFIIKRAHADAKYEYENEEKVTVSVSIKKKKEKTT